MVPLFERSYTPLGDRDRDIAGIDTRRADETGRIDGKISGSTGQINKALCVILHHAMPHKSARTQQ